MSNFNSEWLGRFYTGGCYKINVIIPSWPFSSPWGFHPTESLFCLNSYRFLHLYQIYKVLRIWPADGKCINGCSATNVEGVEDRNKVERGRGRVWRERVGWGIIKGRCFQGVWEMVLLRMDSNNFISITSFLNAKLRKGITVTNNSKGYTPSNQLNILLTRLDNWTLYCKKTKLSNVCFSGKCFLVKY